MSQKTPDIIQLEDEAQESHSHLAPGEVVIGTLVAINAHGQPQVDFPENISQESVGAISTLGLTQQHVGRQVALLFTNGDINNPVVMGIIHSPLGDMLESFNQQQSESGSDVEVEANLNIDDVKVDGSKIIFEAKEEIVFKCGESSITLTKSGKILIRGKYLLNRSTGVNRIMGGSVQVN